jgi:hypothetical protein
VTYLNASALAHSDIFRAVLAGHTGEAFDLISDMTQDERDALVAHLETLRSLMEYSDPRCGHRTNNTACNLRPGHSTPHWSQD